MPNYIKVMRAKCLRPSKAMKRSIEKLEKKYGKFHKKFWVEALPENRVGRGFWDYCEMRDGVVRSLGFLVNHKGEIFRI